VITAHHPYGAVSKSDEITPAQDFCLNLYLLLLVRHRRVIGLRDVQVLGGDEEYAQEKY
jgi:hypothetical protein